MANYPLLPGDSRRGEYLFKLVVDPNRRRYKLDEVIQLTANTITPIPNGPLTKLQAKDGTPVHGTLEEILHRVTRDEHSIRLLQLLRAGELTARSSVSLAPVSGDKLDLQDFERYELTIGEVKDFCARLLIEVVESAQGRSLTPAPLRGPAEDTVEQDDAADHRTRVKLSDQQDEAALQCIRDMGLDPLALERDRSGTPGVRAKLLRALDEKPDPLFVTEKVRTNTWDRLVRLKKVRYSNPPK